MCDGRMSEWVREHGREAPGRKERGLGGGYEGIQIDKEFPLLQV